jgi:hypothetical protein
MENLKMDGNILKKTQRAMGSGFFLIFTMEFSGENTQMLDNFFGVNSEKPQTLIITYQKPSSVWS